MAIPGKWRCLKRNSLSTGFDNIGDTGVTVQAPESIRQRVQKGQAVQSQHRVWDPFKSFHVFENLPVHAAGFKFQKFQLQVSEIPEASVK